MSLFLYDWIPGSIPSVKSLFSFEDMQKWWLLGLMHTHTFNGPLSGTTQVSQYQKCKPNLDYTEAGDSEWHQWHQMGRMQVCTSLQTDNHASTSLLGFYRPHALPAALPTASKHWRPQNTRCNVTFSVFRLSQGSVATLTRPGRMRYTHLRVSFIPKSNRENRWFLTELHTQTC